jgi:hypothetical protein
MIKAEQSSLRYIFGEDCMGYIAKEIARDELHRKGKARTKQWRKRRERRENKRINSELELPILVEYS